MWIEPPAQGNAGPAPRVSFWMVLTCCCARLRLFSASSACCFQSTSSNLVVSLQQLSGGGRLPTTLPVSGSTRAGSSSLKPIATQPAHPMAHVRPSTQPRSPRVRPAVRTVQVQRRRPAAHPSRSVRVKGWVLPPACRRCRGAVANTPPKLSFAAGPTCSTGTRRTWWLQASQRFLLWSSRVSCDGHAVPPTPHRSNRPLARCAPASRAEC